MGQPSASADDRADDVTQNRMKLKQTALASLRYGLSSRATAVVATAVLIDAEVITKERNWYSPRC